MSIASGVEHRYGPYGGQYVPETLMPALEELEAAWLDAWRDRTFRDELDRLLRDYAGRPTPLYLAERMSEVAGRPIYLKREDLLHTGAHKLNNALGQALLARRMGKRRVIAETGAGQHGVGTATACALLGLECVVYMGAEDMRRQRPNVQRMELLGAEVRAVEAGTRTLKEATSEAIRDWVTNVARHALRDRLGDRPGALPGDRARAPARDRRRGARADPRARGAPARPASWPASAAARTRSGRSPRSSATPRVALLGVEAAGEGLESGRHGAPLTVGGRARRPARRADRAAADRRGPGDRGALGLRRSRLPRRRARARAPARHRARHATSR